MYEPRKTGITRRGTPHATCADWTEERVAQLRALWDEVPPLSAREIGLRMGISKSAAIGKAHRTGLPSRSSPIRRVDRVVVLSALKPPVAALPPLASVVSVAPVAASVEVICGLDDTMAASTDVACGLDDEEASTGPVVFYESLGKHECWLPLWSLNAKPDGRFCRAPVEGKGHYCEEHRKVCCIRRPSQPVVVA